MCKPSEIIVALFGESERGDFNSPTLIQTPAHIYESLGSAQENSRGIAMAFQAIHYVSCLLFFRVHEEGYSVVDYDYGLKFLEERGAPLPLTAIYAPGVGDPHLLDKIFAVCALHQSLFITTEQDFYDVCTR